MPQPSVLSSPGGCQPPGPPATPQGPSQPHCSPGDAESLGGCRDTIFQPRGPEGLGSGAPNRGVKTNQGCENKGSSRWERSVSRAPHPVAVSGTLPGCRPGIRCEWGIWGVCTFLLTWASANPLMALIMEVNPLCRQQAGQGCGEEVGSGLGEVGSAPTRMPMGFCSYVGMWEQAHMCVEMSMHRGQRV